MRAEQRAGNTVESEGIGKVEGGTRAMLLVYP